MIYRQTSMIICLIFACGGRSPDVDNSPVPEMDPPPACADGWHWTRIPTEERADIASVWQTSDGERHAQLGNGKVLRYKSERWHRVDDSAVLADASLNTSAETSESIGAPFRTNAWRLIDTSGTALAVGNNGKIGIRRNGAWSVMDSGTRSDLRTIFVGERPFDWIVGGTEGTLLHYICGRLPDDAPRIESCKSKVDVSLDRKLFAVSGRSRLDYYLAGAGGIWHIVAHKPTQIWAQRDARLEGLVRVGDILVGVGVDYSRHRALVVRCKADQCHPQLLPIEGILKDVVAVNNDELVAAGHQMGAQPGGLVVRLERSALEWSRLEPGPPLMPESLALGHGGELWVVGHDIATNSIGLAVSLRQDRWVNRLELPGMVLWGIQRHGEALWVAGAKHNLRAAGDFGVLQTVSGDAWQNTKAQTLAYHAIAFASQTIVGAATRKLSSGEFRHELTAIDSASGQERPICSMPRSMQDIRTMDDGSIVAVGLDGDAVLLQ